jgi:hypothetical protein
MVSFVDTSNGNAVLGTAALTADTGVGFAGSSLLSVASGNIGNTVLTADFNGDGIPDLVILGNGISLLLGNGDGTFTTAPNPPVFLPGTIAVGDFNGDGIPDLAVAPGFDEGDSEVLLGKGDGTFTIAPEDFGNINGRVTSNSIAVGDFNGDGKLDLAEICSSINEQSCNQQLLILLGNGDGTFTQSSAITFFDAGLQFVTAVGDLNGDGYPDLAVTNPSGSPVTILLGDGDGGFTTGASPAAGLYPTFIAAADFNGDGHLDLAATNPTSNTVTILLGNGDGTFTAVASPATGMAPASVAVGDFNGDGVPDLAVANAGSSNVTILLGNGDGTFTAAASPAADTGSTAVSVADFNGDGKEDIVVANSADSSATALLAETALAIATANNILPVGVGIHLVNATYSGDVNYGASTSADTSLTVVPPGLSLSSTPVVVKAGANGISTITVTPTNGFSGTVALECDGNTLPDGTNPAPSCLSIPPVTISGNAPATTMLTIQTQTGTNPVQYVEYVTASNSSGVEEAFTSVTVTVNPPPAGFALTNTPVNIASPGASGTSTITVTPQRGFTGTVTLSCAVTGAAGGVDAPSCSVAAPVPITSTSAVTATLTVNSQATTSPGFYTVTVTGVSAGISESTSLAVAVSAPVAAPGFVLSNTAVTIASPGASGTSTITVTPSGGFTGTVTLSCSVAGPSGAVDAPGCSVAAPVSIAGTSAVTTMLTVNTTAASAVSTPTSYNIPLRNPLRRILPIGGATMAALLFLAPPAFRRRWNPWLGLLLFAVIAGAAIGCGGAMTKTTAPTAATNPGTTAGSYTVTVTGISGATTATTAVTVTVI